MSYSANFAQLRNVNRVIAQAPAGMRDRLREGAVADTVAGCTEPIHSLIVEYQGFLAQMRISTVNLVAANVEFTYGPINKPNVEAIALSRLLGLPNQDSCEIFRSLVSTEHPIRQAVVQYLANLG